MAEKEAFEILVEIGLFRSQTLWDELKSVLLRSKGKIGYKTMANTIGNIVSVKPIRTYLKAQDGFHMKKDRILPVLYR